MATTKPPRAWQRMLSGRRLDLLNPSPLDVEIEDIAHGLARVARWNGQTVGPHVFSVAQHSLLVEAIAGHLDPALPYTARLAVLLHDAPEYVVGDMISPFKAVLGETYKEIEPPARQHALPGARRLGAHRAFRASAAHSAWRKQPVRWSFTIPAWAKFIFPQEPVGAEEA